jgi:hypothetical protein
MPYMGLYMYRAEETPPPPPPPIFADLRLQGQIEPIIASQPSLYQKWGHSVHTVHHTSPFVHVHGLPSLTSIRERGNSVHTVRHIPLFAHVMGLFCLYCTVL